MSDARYKKLAEFTGSFCARCPVATEEKERHTKYRCCDRLFCNFVWRDMPTERRAKYSPDWSADVPLMRGNRCQVDPEDRPFCTAYMCPGWLTDRATRREYERLCAKAEVPPNQMPNYKRKK